MKDQLYELTRQDILADVQDKVKRRASTLNLPKYLGITKDYVVLMQVDSATGMHHYVVRIKLLEYPSLEDEYDMTTAEKVRLSFAGDIAINCTCPAYRYWGYEYIMTQLKSNAGKSQDIYPEIRNPKLEGTLCKHCYRAIKSFGSYWSKIAKDIDSRNFVREVD